MKLVKIIIIAVVILIPIPIIYSGIMIWQRQLPSEQNIINDRVLLIKPIMTKIAYAEDSFYQYYKGLCDESCLTTSIDVKNGDRYNLGLNGFDSLYPYYNYKDDIHLTTENLSKYDTIVLFHNEYVTKEIFKKITQHKNVIYLYPNSLYAQVDVNYHDGTMTLIQGHGYPDGTANGFDWKNDNTELENDCEIGKWNFYVVDNGIMLDCYPENIIKQDPNLLNFIHAYIKAKTL